MKIYEFEALDSSGRKKNATVKAWTTAQAKKKIQQMGLYLTSIKNQDESAYSEHKSLSLFKELKELLFSK